MYLTLKANTELKHYYFSHQSLPRWCNSQLGSMNLKLFSFSKHYLLCIHLEMQPKTAILDLKTGMFALHYILSFDYSFIFLFIISAANEHSWGVTLLFVLTHLTGKIFIGSPSSLF